MKSTAIVVVTIAVVVLMAGALTARSIADENEALKRQYDDYIQQWISKNRSKASLQHSHSENLQNAAAIARRKLILLTDNGEVLAAEML